MVQADNPLPVTPGSTVLSAASSHGMPPNALRPAACAPVNGLRESNRQSGTDRQGDGQQRDKQGDQRQDQRQKKQDKKGRSMKMDGLKSENRHCPYSDPSVRTLLRIRHKRLKSETYGMYQSTSIHFNTCYSLIDELFDKVNVQLPSTGFRFLDVACAPGGFSQFLLDGAGNRAQCLQGFGVTLPVGLGGFEVLVDPAERSLEYRLCYFDLLSPPSTPLPSISPSLVEVVIADAQYLPGKDFQQAPYRGTRFIEPVSAKIALLANQFRLAFEALDEGGLFVFRSAAYSIVPENLFRLIMLCLDFFESVQPFKSEYVHSVDPSFYFVCTGFRRQQYINMKVLDYLSDSYAMLFRAFVPPAPRNAISPPSPLPIHMTTHPPVQQMQQVQHSQQMQHSQHAQQAQQVQQVQQYGQHSHRDSYGQQHSAFYRETMPSSARGDSDSRPTGPFTPTLPPMAPHPSTPGPHSDSRVLQSHRGHPIHFHSSHSSTSLQSQQKDERQKERQEERLNSSESPTEVHNDSKSCDRPPTSSQNERKGETKPESERKPERSSQRNYDRRTSERSDKSQADANGAANGTANGVANGTVVTGVSARSEKKAGSGKRDGSSATNNFRDERSLTCREAAQTNSSQETIRQETKSPVVLPSPNPDHSPRKRQNEGWKEQGRCKDNEDHAERAEVSTRASSSPSVTQQSSIPESIPSAPASTPASTPASRETQSAKPETKSELRPDTKPEIKCWRSLFPPSPPSNAINQQLALAEQSRLHSSPRKSVSSSSNLEYTLPSQLPTHRLHPLLQSSPTTPTTPRTRAPSASPTNTQNHINLHSSTQSSQNCSQNNPLHPMSGRNSPNSKQRNPNVQMQQLIPAPDAFPPLDPNSPPSSARPDESSRGRVPNSTMSTDSQTAQSEKWTPQDSVRGCHTQIGARSSSEPAILESLYPTVSSESWHFEQIATMLEYVWRWVAIGESNACLAWKANHEPRLAAAAAATKLRSSDITPLPFPSPVNLPIQRMRPMFPIAPPIVPLQGPHPPPPSFGLQPAQPL